MRLAAGGCGRALVEHDLTPVVWTLEHIDAMEAAAKAARRRVRVHVEVDTGMSRQGVAVAPSQGAAELPALIAPALRLAVDRV